MNVIEMLARFIHQLSCPVRIASRHRQRQLAIERFESRRLLAVTWTDGRADIVGTHLNDTVYVRIEDSDLVVRLNGQETVLPSEEVNLIFTQLGKGDDTYRAPRVAIRQVVIAGAGNDSVITGPNADRVFGNSGRDFIRGYNGDDFIDGGDGDDVLNGNPGNDTILGGNGNDRIQGGFGNDRLFGGTGNDTIRGQSGRDLLDGGDGDDYLIGGPNADRLRGKDGNDSMLGDAQVPAASDGNDFMNGGPGNDAMAGGGGDDDMRGGPGADGLRGGSGNDELRGGPGPDILYGQAGVDKSWGMSGNDSIFHSPGEIALGGPGNDRIEEARISLQLVGVPNHGTVDFGNYERGTQQIRRQFTLRNTGNIPVSLPRVIQGFKVVGLPRTLREGESVTFTLILDTSVVGERRTTARFGLLEDGDEHALNVTFVANVYDPDLPGPSR